MDSNVWTEGHEKAFRDKIHAISTSVSLHHTKPDYDRCLFTDASLESYSIVITQVHPEEFSKPLPEQNHLPLAFFSRSFRGSSARWAIPEKEAFPIIDSIQRFDYLVIYDRKLRIFTDHRNLMFIFNQETTSVPYKQHTLDKLYRWSLKLTSLDYIIEYFPGHQNVWADMLSRWGSPNNPVHRACRIKRQSKMPAGVVVPMQDLVFPTLKEIIEIQNQNTSECTGSSFTVGNTDFVSNSSGLYANCDGAVWIPDGATTLQLRILIVAHCGSAGHRDVSAMLAALSPRFFWSGMRADVAEFVRLCLHCIPGKAGDVVPRPFGATVTPHEANEILDFDYLYIGPSNFEFKQLLFVRDRLSGYVDMFLSSEPNAVHVAESLLDWFSRHGIANMWVTDRGSHFANNVIAELRIRLCASHHFHLAYCPWTHAGVETVNSHILAVMRSLQSEFRLTAMQWPLMLPIVRSVINHTISPGLRFAPITLFTGREPSTPLDCIWNPKLDDYVSTSLSTEEMVDLVKDLKHSLAKIHSTVEETRINKRIQKNLKRPYPAANFTIGDYVLYAMPQQPYSGNLAFKWHGPARIVKIVSDFVSSVENLVTKDISDIHAQRLRFYSDESLNLTDELLTQIAHDDQGFEIEDIVEAKCDRKGLWSLKIRWRGMPAEFDHWEGLSHFLSECPRHVISFVKNPNSHRLTNLLHLSMFLPQRRG